MAKKNHEESQIFRSLKANLILKAKVTSFQTSLRHKNKQFMLEGKFYAGEFLKILTKICKFEGQLTLKFKVTSF